MNWYFMNWYKAIKAGMWKTAARPYGYWIDPNGVVHKVVGKFQHEEAMRNLLNQKAIYEDEDEDEDEDDDNLYKMTNLGLKLGYIRVVLHFDCACQMEVAPSLKQRKILIGLFESANCEDIYIDFNGKLHRCTSRDLRRTIHNM